SVRHEDAFPALIDLLDELPLEQGRDAEDRLLDLAGEQGPKVALAGDAESRRKCRDAWAAWGRRHDGPGLLEQVRRPTPSDASRDRALGLIKGLGNDDFAVRQRASVELVAMGQAAVPLLRLARTDPDPEVRQRARACLESIQHETDPGRLALA